MELGCFIPFFRKTPRSRRISEERNHPASQPISDGRTTPFFSSSNRRTPTQSLPAFGTCIQGYHSVFYVQETQCITVCVSFSLQNRYPSLSSGVSSVVCGQKPDPRFCRVTKALGLTAEGVARVGVLHVGDELAVVLSHQRPSQPTGTRNMRKKRCGWWMSVNPFSRPNLKTTH